MSFGGTSVLSFESRRAKEIAELIRLNGGQPFVAPSLVELPIEDNPEAFRFADRLYEHEFDMVIFLTGVGTRFLSKVLATREPEHLLPDALRQVTVVARGPKPMAVLREWQVPVQVQVPEPNTYRELLDAVKDRPEKRVAVQEYGRPNGHLIGGLQTQGREVTSVPVYQWGLPDDLQPLQTAVTDLLAGRYSAVLFTTGVQIDHLLQVASLRRQSDEVEEALRRVFVASIGPTCTEALQEHGIQPALEPSHPKMGILVREAGLAFADRYSRGATLGQ